MLPRRRTGIVLWMRTLALLSGLLFAAGTLAQAPAGYRTYENKLAGVKFYYPITYKEIPVPPTEQTVVAKYLISERPGELKRVDDRVYKAAEPQLYVFHFEVEAPKTGETPAGDAKPATVREAMEENSKVGSWDEFTKRFGNWDLKEDTRKPGNYALRFKPKWGDEAKPIGYLVKKQEGNSIFGVYGFSLSPHEKPFMAHVQKMAGGMQIADEDASSDATEAIDRIYASGKFRAVEWRKKARAELAKGWRALDTENFLIVHHSKNEKLIRLIARDIEAMRALYAELFPATRKMDSVSIVRVCRTLEEYHQYGGPPNTGGYWHPGNEELVFYDYSYSMKGLDSQERRAMGRVKTDEDSLLVLYHEAFHQYIHYAIGEFSPHDWFNEGHGDYFSGALVADNTGRVLRVGPALWRIHLAKDMAEFGEGAVGLKEMLEAERAVFYNPARIRFFYASAWSFVYFLRNAKEVAQHERWSKILTDYFANVKAAYAEELAKAGDNPDLQAKMEAGFRARKAAHGKTFDGIDLAALEQAWKKWVVDLKDPWPELRKKRKSDK